MKKTITIALSCLSIVSFGQQSDSTLLRQVSDEIMLHGTCYDNLRVLTKQIGHRLSGSPEAERAVAWGADAMKAAGADTVYLQPVEVPLWTRGKEQLMLQLDHKNYSEVEMLSLGNTDGTQGVPLEAEVLEVGTLDAFAALSPAAVKGKIVFFNYRFRQDIVNTFEGYGDAVKYRWMTVNKASEKGAAAVIIRSVSTGPDAAPHTGMSRYLDSVQHIPAVAIGNTTADALEAACKNGSVKARLQSECLMKGTVMSYNVIGEIKGTVPGAGIMVVGGHLDSWDVGEGAHDDGAGCVQSIEVLRTLKALNIKPRHTIRAVLYMNEENGARGGNAYADSALVRKEKHTLAMESDAGGFTPRGMGLDMPEPMKQKIRSWSPLFQRYGVYDFDQEEGGVDIGPLKKQGVPLMGLLPDSQRYFDLHHSRNDVFEAVSHRELKLGAWLMTSMLLLADRHL